MRVAIGASSFAQADPTPLRILEAAGIEVVPNPYGRRMTEDEIISHLAGADGLLAGLETLSRRVLSAATSLKSIARIGIGMDNVDVEAARDLGIKVSNTPDAPTDAVAELTVTAALALCRQLVACNADLHSRQWEKRIGRTLLGAKVLLVGYGRIGRRVAEMLRPFSPEILVTDPFIDPTTLAHGERLVSLHEGLAEAEIISLHLSGRDTLLGPAEFDVMREGVILLNSARAGLVDETALYRALDSGKVEGAWFDVFWQEPYFGRLADYPQVLMTPHVGTYTARCRADMERAAVLNLLRDLNIPAQVAVAG